MHCKQFLFGHDEGMKVFVCIEIKVVNNKQIEKIDTDSPTAPRLMLDIETT